MEVDNNRGAMSNLLSLYLNKNMSGKVHSKFKHGLNIQFDDILIYISYIGSPLVALGLVIDEKKLNDILNSTRIDNVVINKEGKLIFYNIENIITLDYAKAKQLDLKLPKVNWKIGQLSENRLFNYLLDMELERYIGIDLDVKTVQYLQLLLKSNKSDLNINSSIVRFFAGRGKGLTPSGDDILIGFTMALITFGEFDHWIEALQQGITKGTTTMVSVSYLWALMKGYTSEYFIRLVKLMDVSGINEIEVTIKIIQSIGHTSGNDTLYGFSLGLKYLTGW